MSFELYAESWSGKTEQIKVTGNKILLINSSRRRETSKYGDLHKKATQDSDYSKM